MFSSLLYYERGMVCFASFVIISQSCLTVSIVHRTFAWPKSSTTAIGKDLVSGRVVTSAK